MNTRAWGIAALLLGVLILGAAVFISYEAINEAFGSGPPYYSRTTNMDKWSDPLPELLIGDLVAVAVSGILLWFGIKHIHPSKTKVRPPQND